MKTETEKAIEKAIECHGVVEGIKDAYDLFLCVLEEEMAGLIRSGLSPEGVDKIRSKMKAKVHEEIIAYIGYSFLLH